jgi:hypothetical protein
MSARRRVSAFSAGVVFSSRANTMSRAIRNSITPPPMRNASMLMPMIPMNQLPLSANTTRIVSEIAAAFSAMRRR